jgi:hypothetical protein
MATQGKAGQGDAAAQQGIAARCRCVDSQRTVLHKKSNKTNKIKQNKRRKKS